MVTLVCLGLAFLCTGKKQSFARYGYGLTMIVSMLPWILWLGMDHLCLRTNDTDFATPKPGASIVLAIFATLFFVGCMCMSLIW